LVTKTVPERLIWAAYHKGEREFGENRVQELLSEQQSLPDDIKWHMIGHLQTNKIKKIIRNIALIQSLDRYELVDEIQSHAVKQGLEKIPCLVQINISEEKAKSGILVDQVDQFVEYIENRRAIEIKGIMAMGPYNLDEANIRGVFRKAKKIRDQCMARYSSMDWGILSMGMSSDYQIAIEEGATMIRVGSAVFGQRNDRL